MSGALQFSGGKDSTALLHLLKERRGELTVYFGDTGAVYPHVSRFVRDTCEAMGYRLKVVRPRLGIEKYQAWRGLPSDIVPVEASLEMQPYLKDRRTVLLQSPLTCCAAMVWLPLQQAMRDDGITDVYRGSKAADGHVGAPDGFAEQGITWHSPLWNWSDDDVFAYLAQQGAALPSHYDDVNSSFDCMTCTAFLNHPGAEARLRWTRARYPDAWPDIAGRLARVRGAVAAESMLIADALNLADRSDA